jgi:hypothetical protein
MVIGRVRELHVEESAPPPLPFLRGGYRGLASAPGSDEIGAALKYADLVRGECERFALELGLGCSLSAVVGADVYRLWEIPADGQSSCMREQRR